MAGSERQSTTPGHIAAAVCKVKKSRTVVLGFYSISENNDRLSASTVREDSTNLTELKLLYNTQHVIVAGDFNAVLEPEDSSSREIRKQATSAALHQIIERHNLADLARKSNKLEHTWYKKGIISQSSIIDLILTSIPIKNIKMSNTHTFFDHTFLAATISQAKSPHATSMKDYIIGSDEFLIRSIDQIEQHIAAASRPLANTRNEEQEQQEDDEANQQHNCAMDENRDFYNNYTGKTPLHIFNLFIKKLHTIHNEIAKEKKNKINKKIRDISFSVLRLKQQIRNTRDPMEKR
jgi:hypothetical protein